MKRDGSVLIYVLILMIPIMFLSLSLLEISNTNFTISNNTVLSRQAQYNAETGVIFGIRKVEESSNNGNSGQYNIQENIIFDNKTNVKNSINFCEININYFNNKFTITSNGYYKGIKRTKIIIINKNP